MGNLTTLVDRANTASQSFQYDALNRLSGATGAYGAYQFHFDPLGDLTQKDSGITLTYGTKPHAVTRLQYPGAPAINLTYDANGNLTQKASQTLT